MAQDAVWKDREIEILRLIRDGLSDRAVAKRLRVSPETVRWYNKRLYRRLQVSSRSEAVARALALGLIDPSAQMEAVRETPRSPIRYLERDGTSIAYQIVGDGPADLVFIHGFLSHLEIAWEDPEFTSFFTQLGRHARIVLFDKRGVGLSDRDRGASTPEVTVADVSALLDAVGMDRVHVFGTSEGTAAALLLALKHPRRIASLILFGATPAVVQRVDGPPFARTPEDFAGRIERLVSTWGDPWAVDQFAPSRARDERFRAWWSRLLRAASSPSSARAVLEAARDTDVRALLSQVPTRTLVAHRQGDRLLPVAAGRYLAEHLPNATFVELPGDDHIYFVDSADLLRVVAGFLRDADGALEGASHIAVVLHAAEPVVRLDSLARRTVEEFGGRGLQSVGGGWWVIFDGAADALACARSLSAFRGARAPALVLHLGVFEGLGTVPGDPTAATLARLAAAGRPGEVVLSATLRDILPGAGIPVVERPLPDDVSGAWTGRSVAWVVDSTS